MCFAHLFFLVQDTAALLCSSIEEKKLLNHTGKGPAWIVWLCFRKRQPSKQARAKDDTRQGCNVCNSGQLRTKKISVPVCSCNVTWYSRIAPERIHAWRNAGKLGHDGRRMQQRLQDKRGFEAAVRVPTAKYTCRTSMNVQSVCSSWPLRPQVSNFF